MTTKKAPLSKNAGNESATMNGRLDAWFAAAPDFARPILLYLRSLVHRAAPDAVETIKWSRVFFVVDGTLVCYVAWFTRHCALGFWSPEMTALLTADGRASVEGSGSFGRVQHMADLPAEEELLHYLQHAFDLARTGSASTPMATGRRSSAKPEIAIPPVFADALRQSAAAAETFQTLPRGCRREYLDWITSAKRTETQQRRIAEAIRMLAAGKRYNEQYRAKQS